MSMYDEPTVIALTMMDGGTIIQTTLDPMNDAYYTDVYCLPYGKQFITVGVDEKKASAMSTHNHWVGVMAADIQPAALHDVVDGSIHPRLLD